jgi:intracellular septation protein A
MPPPSGRPIRFGSFAEEVALNWNNWVRQLHRWLAIAFTVAAVVNIVALGQEKPAVWVGLLALLPLVLLLLTGLYLFVLPYAIRWHSGSGGGG